MNPNRTATPIVINKGLPTAKDMSRSEALLNSFHQLNQFESEVESEHRVNMLALLEARVRKWFRSQTTDHNSLLSFTSSGARVLTFGSFKLGAHTKGADMDVLVLGPAAVKTEEFLASFPEQLRRLPVHVQNLQVIENAFVPVIKVTLGGVPFDIVYSPQQSVSQYDPSSAGCLDLVSPDALRNLPTKCVRAINGCRVTEAILASVQNPRSFQVTLVAVKLWAARRKLYGNAVGYLGGVSWALLVARICQLFPNAAPSRLMHKFFLLFSEWPWPLPVRLELPANGPEQERDQRQLGYSAWDARSNPVDREHIMPIITPCYPEQNSAYNVTRSTFAALRRELQLARAILQAITCDETTWMRLFQPLRFFDLYVHFLVVKCTAQLQWVGLVTSKIRLLVRSLEQHPSLKEIRLNPESYTLASPIELKESGELSTCSGWFIGLKFHSEALRSGHVDLSGPICQFVQKTTSASHSDMFKKCRLCVTQCTREHVAHLLPAMELQLSEVQRKRKKQKTQTHMMKSTTYVNK